MNTTTEQKLRNTGPPIYTTCGVWLDFLKELPIKDVSDTIKGLAVAVSRFLPHHEKTQGKKTLEGADPALEMLTPHDTFEDWNTSYNRFRSGLVLFLTQMSNFAECSVKTYAQLHTNVADAKRNYEHKMSQP